MRLSHQGLSLLFFTYNKYYNIILTYQRNTLDINLIPAQNLIIAATGAIKIPVGTTAQRQIADNRIRFNNTNNVFEASSNLLQILQSLSSFHKAKMFRLAFILTLLVISIVNLWALSCKECKGESPLGDKKDCWEGKDGVDQGK